MADATLILGLAGVGGTIAGTVAGATIASRTTAAVEDRRERRQERAEAAELKMAARLVRADLAVSDGNLSWAILRDKWHPVKVRLPLDAWEQHGGRLALGIEDVEAWDRIYHAHVGLGHLKAAAHAFLEPNDSLGELIESMKEMRTVLLAADEVLCRLAGHEGGRETTGFPGSREVGVE